MQERTKRIRLAKKRHRHELTKKKRRRHRIVEASARWRRFLFEKREGKDESKKRR